MKNLKMVLATLLIATIVYAMSMVSFAADTDTQQSTAGLGILADSFTVSTVESTNSYDTYMVYNVGTSAIVTFQSDGERYVEYLGYGKTVEENNSYWENALDSFNDVYENLDTTEGTVTLTQDGVYQVSMYDSINQYYSLAFVIVDSELNMASNTSVMAAPTTFIHN